MGKYLLVWLVMISLTTCRSSDPVPSSAQLESIEFVNVPIRRITKLSSNNWVIIVPYQTDLRQITPILTIAPDVTSIPYSGKPVDFSRPILFTLTDASGAKVAYQIQVQTEAQPNPQLIKLSADTVQAGGQLIILGRNFGTFPPSVSVRATSAASQTLLLSSSLLDSNRIQVQLPTSLQIGRHELSVTVGQVQSDRALSLLVRFPSPRLMSVFRHYLLTGDTLIASGEFIQPTAYKYNLQLENAARSNVLVSPVGSVQGQVAGLLPLDLVPGRYQVTVLNRSENTDSKDTTVFIQVYDSQKPFIKPIQLPVQTYQPGQTVSFHTQQFDVIPARFYQFQLSNSIRIYVSNGVYDTTKKQVFLTLPSSMQSGSYTVQMQLVSESGQTLYAFSTDWTVLIP